MMASTASMRSLSISASRSCRRWPLSAADQLPQPFPRQLNPTCTHTNRTHLLSSSSSSSRAHSTASKSAQETAAAKQYNKETLSKLFDSQRAMSEAQIQQAKLANERRRAAQLEAAKMVSLQMLGDEGKNHYFSQHASVDDLLERNKAWAARVKVDAPEFFPSLANSQAPKILWIGCSDSRVPETTVLDLLPGEVFVHRNIANVVANGDMSMLCVVQFAVEVLQVQHVIVCGHYGCGGVNAALGKNKLGLIDNWLRYVRDVRASNEEELAAIANTDERAARLVELNVLAQVRKLERINYVYEAEASRGLQVYGMVYDVASGLLKRLDKPVDEKKKCYLQDTVDLSGH